MARKSFLNLIGLALIALLIPAFARTQTPLFSIKCRFIFSKSADIFVRIVNQTQFDKREGSVCEAQIKIGQDRAKWEVKPGKDSVCNPQIENREEQSKRKEVAIKFDNIPQGKYGVLCYQNVNKKKDDNKKGPDTNFIGLPTEPWGVSNNARPFLRKPKFNEIAFEVDKRILEMQIEVK